MPFPFWEGLVVYADYFLYIITKEHIMEENWRDVPGYEGLYQISIDTPEGRCRSLNYHREGQVKYLSNNPRTGNRIGWSLCKNGQVTHYQAAKWIALTFPELVQGEYYDGAVIDHINTDSMDNRPENLRWCSPKTNQSNPLTKKHRKDACLNNPKTSKPVNQYSKQGYYIATYPSVNEAERQTGVPKQNISACCLGKAKSAGKVGAEKFIWKYTN